MTTPSALALASLFLLVGCDLAHLEQKRFCARATPDECRSRPDWCFALGGPSCTGTLWAPTYCEPDGATRSCVRREPTRNDCARDGRFVVKGVLELSSYAWKRERLTPATRERAGERLTAQLLEQMPPSDRRELCGSLPDEPCELSWGPQGAACLLSADPCVGARYREEPVRCYAKNLCNGVICP